MVASKRTGSIWVSGTTVGVKRIRVISCAAACHDADSKKIKSDAVNDRSLVKLRIDRLLDVARFPGRLGFIFFAALLNAGRNRGQL